MFRRARGYTESVGKLSPEDLLKKRVYLICFVSRLFGIIITNKNGSMSGKILAPSVMIKVGNISLSFHEIMKSLAVGGIF